MASLLRQDVASVIPLVILALVLVVAALHSESPGDTPLVRYIDADATEADVPQGDGSEIPADDEPAAVLDWTEDLSDYAGEEGVDW